MLNAVDKHFSVKLSTETEAQKLESFFGFLLTLTFVLFVSLIFFAKELLVKVKLGSNLKIIVLYRD